MKKFKIAIDGPCGSGKTTAAKALAAKTGGMYLDTGGIFRGFAYFALYIAKKNPDELSSAELDELAKKCIDSGLEVDHDINRQMTFRLNGQNITDKIRSSEVSDMASRIAVYPEIRSQVLVLEQTIIQRHNVIAEGRDIGSTVIPDADIKFYLTADLDIRTHRRRLQSPNEFNNFHEARDAMEQRDVRDMNRDIAPLKELPDAIRIDNTSLTIDETVNLMYLLAKAKIRSI